MRQELEVIRRNVGEAAPNSPYSYERVANLKLRAYMEGLEPQMMKLKGRPVTASCGSIARQFSPALGLDMEDVYKLFEQVRWRKVIEFIPKIATNGRIAHYLIDPPRLRAFFALCWTIHEEAQEGRRMYLEERVVRVRRAFGDDPLKEWLKDPEVYRKKLDESNAQHIRIGPPVWVKKEDEKEIIEDEEDARITGIERRSQELGRVPIIIERLILEIASKIDRRVLVQMWHFIPREWTEEVSFRKVPFLSPDLVRILGFNAMQRLGRLRDFDLSLEDYLSYPQLLRWIAVNIKLFDENPTCGTLLELFHAQRDFYFSGAPSFVPRGNRWEPL